MNVKVILLDILTIFPLSEKTQILNFYSVVEVALLFAHHSYFSVYRNRHLSATNNVILDCRLRANKVVHKFPV